MSAYDTWFFGPLDREMDARDRYDVLAERTCPRCEVLQPRALDGAVCEDCEQELADAE